MWAKIQEPRPGSSDELAQTTQLYLDTHIALEYFHCSYQQYIEQTPQKERLLYQLFVMLKNAKEQYAQEQAEAQAEADREAQAMTNTRY